MKTKYYAKAQTRFGKSKSAIFTKVKNAQDFIDKIVSKGGSGLVTEEEQGPVIYKNAPK